MKTLNSLNIFPQRVIIFINILSIALSGLVIPINSSLSNSITWNMTIIDGGMPGISWSLLVGNPYHGFGHSNRHYLYTTDFIFNFVEYSYNSGVWTENIITPDAYYGMGEIGDARNEGFERIYCSDNSRFISNERIYEIWNENETWHRNTIFEYDSGMIGPIEIGKVRNDSLNRFYITLSYSVVSGEGWRSAGKIVELTYTGPGQNDWQIAEVATDMGANCIGDGRNDGVMRIYGFGGESHRTLYELSYEPENDPPWVKREIWEFRTDIFEHTCYGPIIGRGRTYDDLNRLYWGDPYGRVNELIWTGYSWENELIELKEPELIDWAYFLPSFIEDKSNDPPKKYFVTASDTTIFLCTHNGNEWESTVLTTFHIKDWEILWLKIKIGDVRQIGDYALYVYSSNGEIYEFYPMFFGEEK